MCAVQTHTHTTSCTLLLARFDWQYSSPNPCRHHLQVCAPTLSSSNARLKQEKRWESTAKKQLCTPRAALYLPTQALATHLCSKMAAPTLWCCSSLCESWSDPLSYVVLCDRTPTTLRVGQYFHLSTEALRAPDALLVRKTHANRHTVSKLREYLSQFDHTCNIQHCELSVITSKSWLQQ